MAASLETGVETVGVLAQAASVSAAAIRAMSRMASNMPGVAGGGNACQRRMCALNGPDTLGK